MTIQPIAIRYPQNFPDNTCYSKEISLKSEKGEMLSLYLDFLMKPKSHVIMHFLEKINTRDYNALDMPNILADRINQELDNLNP